MTQPNPSPQRIAEVAAGLTEAQRRTVLMIGENVIRAQYIHASTGRALFKRGIITKILAAGHRFTSLDHLGLAVCNHLRAIASKDAEDGR